MNIFNDLGIGFKTYIKAFGFIFSKGLWWFFLFPVLLNILLFYGGFTFTDILSEATKTCLSKWINIENLGFLKGFISLFIWFVFKILFFSGFYLFWRLYYIDINITCFSLFVIKNRKNNYRQRLSF
jgi:CysZ protein